ncbi:MAG TPA: PAS domain-containing sensor histidine kinase [Candidatus Thermoplasmatota archaeon]|nr:PAS domain-containing sensor histidine kinase [Candidatus Thermoplasmatota archaeon]
MSLPAATWEARHRIVLWVVAAHVVLLPAFGLWRGWGPGYSLGEGCLIAGLGLLARAKGFSRRFRSATAALAAVTCSAIVTQFSGGFIEAHFHYFVMVALVALYQDWVPFLLAIVYVAFDHGVIGTLLPAWVYNHPDASIHPWRWAGIHAGAVLAECAALLVFWSAAEQARARADLVFESAGDAILDLGLDGRVTYANPAAARLLGATPDGLVGQDVRPRLQAPDPAAWALDEQSRGPVEGWLPLAGGTRAVEWTVAPTRRAGVTVGYHVILRDTTERKQAEEDRRRVEMLEKQNRFKSQLLNATSHELNTPIAILLYQVHWLRDKLPNSPAVQEGAAMLEQSAERLSNLVRDTLEVARIENGKLPLQPTDLDLADVVVRACKPLAGMAQQRGICLDVEAAPGLPARVDEGRVTQVLFNLVSNALNFTPGGGRIQVRAARAGDWVRVQVEDTGPGVPSEAIPQLFQPFSQVAATRPKTAAGTGLGLFISKGIVEAHGGRIWCESRAGEGATFLFEVPLALARWVERPADGLQQVARPGGLLHERTDAGLEGALAHPGV